jgi:hypothetical protein
MILPLVPVLSKMNQVDIFVPKFFLSWYGLDDRGSRVRFSAGAGNFSFHHRVQNGSGAHPVSYPMSTTDLSLGVKRTGREADHSPPSSAEVKV